MVQIASFPRYFLPISWLIGSIPRVFLVHHTDVIPSMSNIGLVMVAKIEGEKNMVVIQRVGEDVYSMCALKKDLKIKDVRTITKAARDKQIDNVNSRNVHMPMDEGEWWQGTTVRKLNTQNKRDVSLKFLKEDISIKFHPLNYY